MMRPGIQLEQRWAEWQRRLRRARIMQLRLGAPSLQSGFIFHEEIDHDTG
ncbi:hypothetical protein M622_17930 [Thauera terpenica 58Eu]|uniref:Uncharacterized protein n=1 Tax=Thauera terpenica 58Eu TaxID=1348657 RepID=S9ZBQ4_9RHOO|nr:hypothetical protein M622_17930 [Thauera terpenica 58Eu]